MKLTYSVHSYSRNSYYTIDLIYLHVIVFNNVIINDANFQSVTL